MKIAGITLAALICAQLFTATEVYALDFYRCIDNTGKAHITNLPKAILDSDCKLSINYYEYQFKQDHQDVQKKTYLNKLKSQEKDVATDQPATAEDLSFAEAINKAGRQRMLTQRITKSYCQIGLNVVPEKSRHELEEAINLFSSQLLELERFSTGTEVDIALENIKLQWNSFKALALTVPSQENAKRLTEMDEELLQASDHLVQMLENLSGVPTSRLVNIAGRQRMLSQRLTKFHMLQLWHQGSAEMSSEIERATNEFKGALDTLIQAPENTVVIKAKLEAAKLQWARLNSSLNFSRDEHFSLIALDASEKMLQIMERVTELYQKVADLPQN